ncbi:MAG: 4-(cytidine 5'-diphospho)-2-C-methyl-D-erythritol kinase [bacterium]
MSTSSTPDRSLLPRQVIVRSPAKVNLHLEVLRQRRDGYHDIETVLQAVQLFDTVKVTLRKRFSNGAPQVELRVVPTGAAPTGRENLCWRAARLFCATTGVSGRLGVELVKEIPTAAGLGGGSSNAAAVLVACNHLFGSELTPAELESMAAELGSDVPFFIRGGTQFGHGRGTELTAMPAVRRGQFLLIKPDIDLLTANVYTTLKMGLTSRAPKANIPGMKSLIARFPTSSWFGFNRLEEVVLPSYPELQRLVLHLRELAPVVMLSGSGAAVVAVFPDRCDIPKISEEFARSDWFVRVVGPHAVGVEIRDG